MKPDKIQIGHVYSVKLNGRCQPVLITGKRKDGWTGEVVGQKKPTPVTITDPATVRTHCPALTKKFGMPAAKAEAADEEAKSKRRAATRATRGRQGAKQRKRRGGILDVAAQILAETKKPMHTKEIVEVALKRKLWQTKGKTPAATLYSAVIREIAKKGKDARFRKVEGGKFALAKKEA